MKKPHVRLAFAGCLAIFWTAGAMAQSASTQPSSTVRGASDLSSLKLEDLMNIEVTSVSKSAQKISAAPAAITVISPDDFSRSGLNSIPEALRLVPGLDVEQINANRWAITSRGFNGLFADDLLVLMDGRSVYTPVFGGVRWSTVDYPLGDLDRIEVIRGPGSTLWGSNAVNGVINIQTKSSEQTQGWSIDSRASTDQSEESARYGGRIDDQTTYRIYEKASYTDSGVTSMNDPAHDNWYSYQGGFRIDRAASPKDALTLQGDGYYQKLNDVGFVLTSSLHSDNESGGNIEGRWTHTESANASTTVQVYYDRQQAQDLPSPYEQNTFDVEFQNRLPIGDRNELTWGLGAQDTEIDFSELYPHEYDPRHWSDYLYNGFLQDQWTLLPDQLQWYFGTKLEYGKVVNFQVQPSTRLLWTPDERNSVWAAVSRSVRTPSLYQEESLNLGGFDVDHAHLGAEQSISYELGYKVQPVKSLTVDVTGFYNSYRDLINYNPTFTFGFPSGIRYNNDLSGNTYGIETSANWHVTPQWRLGGSYSLARVIIRPQGHDGNFVPSTVQEAIEGSTPQNQFQLHSYLDLTKNLQFNTSVYYVDALPTLNLAPAQSQNVPAHVRLDMNLAWQPRDNMTVEIGVQNLLQNRHSEFGNFNSNVNASELQRAFYVQCGIAF